MIDIKGDFIDHLSDAAEKNNRIAPHFYDDFNVKRGLRNSNGTGVLVGLTDVSSVDGYILENGIKMPAEGKLAYRGIDLSDLVHGFQSENRYGFEETIYLLLFGNLPSSDELLEFNELLDSLRNLPTGFTENMILKIPSKDIMNKLQRSTLVLYSHDDDPDNLEIKNVLKQSLKLIARFPTIISYGYQAKAHYFDHKSLYIHAPQPGIGTARNILHMIRPDNKYTETEAKTLDLLIVIHADHGGGNNSAFATHVVASSGTDTYSAITAALGSLKGAKHGGANLMVYQMIQDIKSHVDDYSDLVSLKCYLKKIINKEAFDQKGLIYGMGHAVYTLSDPRAVLLKEKAYELAIEKNSLKTFALYENIDRLTRELMKERKGADYPIAANVDLYAGFVYEMLGIPSEMFTALFAISRVAGWCAHRIEQLVSDSKIMRPAYMCTSSGRAYCPLKDRK